MEVEGELFAAAVTLLLGVWGCFHRYARGVKQDIRDVKPDFGGRTDRYEAANRDEHAKSAKLDKQGNALEFLKVEVGKLSALRGRTMLDTLKERWFPEPDKPPDNK